MWYVYIVECSDGSLYTGTAKNVNKRVLKHNSGKGAKYTKARRPVLLKAFKEYPDRSLACKEESRIKKLTRLDKYLLIEQLQSRNMNVMKDSIKTILREDLSKEKKVFYPPKEASWDWDPKKYKSVFLAGSIEMGKAEDWQDKVIKSLEDEHIVFFNPRRGNWDSSWKQEIGNKKFKEQVLWELNHIDFADLVVLYLDPDTKSPISLLELGLCAGKGKLIVCCPEGFWRKGNVDIVCEKYGIKQVKDLDELIQAIKKA